MKTVIKGQRYTFDIVGGGEEFYIKALHRASSRFSCINNLNAILSELNVSLDDERFEDSQWVLSKKQSGLFFKRAVGLLQSGESREYIERKLDEDRDCGEWENRQRIKRKRAERSER